jgi:serine/threonine-protein kinase
MPMGSERWKRVEAIVAAALELEASSREAFLTHECGDDSSLRSEVDGILKGEGLASAFLGGVADLQDTPVGDDDPRTNGPLLDSTIGPYRIHRLIGSGGMGVVYLVDRADDEYEQKAALKLLHRGMTSPTYTRRFRTERQILAVLEHPNIARLLDGGTTEDGRPFLVMEYVEGSPIDEYCDEHLLDLGERIELFLDVCSAVSFAHRNLVVHRDIKPSNILVNADGSPKLLDFGIAKLLDASAIPGGGEQTRTGFRPMSPPYASPEQFRGGAITTGSDVYSLGVVLYKLLTGALPRHFDDHTPAGIEKSLRREPVTPSATVRRINGIPPVPHRRLRGDLDAIVLKALREEPERRYASVAELVGDLRRYLKRLPVSARQGSFGYRASRFLRRNALAVAASALVSTIAIGSAVTLYQQNRRITYQRDRAESLASFSSGLLSIDHMAWALNPQREVTTQLWKNISEAENSLSEDPPTRADQLMLLSRGHFSLGSINTSADFAAESLRIKRNTLGVEHPSLRPLMNDLGFLRCLQGRLDEAGGLLEQAIGLPRTEGPEEHREIARTHILIAIFHLYRSQLSEAQVSMSEALEILDQELDEPNIDSADQLVALATLTTSEDPGSKEAEGLLRRALVIYDNLDEGSPLKERAVQTLAEIHAARGEYARAVDVYGTIPELDPRYRSRPFADHALRYWSLLFLRGELQVAAVPMIDPFKHHLSLAELPRAGLLLNIETQWIRYQLEIGNLDTAEVGCEQFLSRARGMGTPNTDHAPDDFRVPYKLAAHHGLAQIQLRRGDFEQARLSAMEYLRISEVYGRSLPTDNKVSIAEVFLSTGDLGRAETLLRGHIDDCEDEGIGWDPECVRAIATLADLLRLQGQPNEAESHVEAAREIVNRQASIDPSPLINKQLAQIHRVQGDLYRDRGEVESAENEWREGLRILSLNPDETFSADHHLIAGETLIRLGDKGQAGIHAQALNDLGWRWPEWVATLGE